jgi:tape measure domain-containing protein
MARITIEISDSIQSSVVTKIKEIGDNAKASQLSIEQLNNSLNTLNITKSNKSQKDQQFAMERMHTIALDMDAKRRFSQERTHQLAIDQYNKVKLMQEKTHVLALDMEEKLKFAKGRTHQLALDQYEKIKTRQERLHQLALDMEQKIMFSKGRTHQLAIDMDNKRKFSQERTHTLALDMDAKRKSSMEKMHAIALDMENKRRISIEKAHVLALDMENKRKIAMEKMHAQAIQMNEKMNSKGGFENLFTLNNLMRAFVAIKSVERIVQIADSYTLMENRIKLISKSTENLLGLQSELFRIANNARVPVVELTQSFVRFDYALKALGATQRESLKFTKTLSQTLAISGLTTQEQSSALLQLSQALNKGKLDGDEFRTVMETLPTVATAIAKQMGVARGELIKLAPQGKITSEIIRDAIASIADETDKAFSNLTPTIGQAFTVMQNKIIENIGVFNQATGASEIFAKALLVLADNLGTLTLAATLSATIFATRFIPVVISGITRIGVASTALLANPVFLLPAVLAASFIAIKSIFDKRNAEIDAQTDRDNAKADEFERQQERRRKALIYETEATIKLRTEYGKYLVLLAESKDAKERGFISERAKEALLLETVIGKGQEKAQELINKKPQAVLSDAEILEKERKDIKSEYDNSLVDLENFIRASVELRNEQTKKEIQSRKDLIAEEATKQSLAKKLSVVEAQPDTIFSSNKEELAQVKELIKLNESRLKEKENIFNFEFKTGELTTENLKKNIDLQSNLKKALEERLLLLNRIGIETIKADIKNSRDRMQKEYNDTLQATNELVKEGNINEAQKSIILSNTNKIRELLRTNEKADAFSYKTESQKRLESINKETTETLRLVDANIKLFESYQDYLDARDKITKGSDRQKDELKKEIDRSSLVASGGSISNVRLEEIEREEQRFKDYQKTIESLKNDELKKAGENESQKEAIKKEYLERELRAKKEHENKLNAIDSDAASKRLAIAANMFGALSDLAGVFAQKGMKGAKEMFYISQALALAQATVSTASAISSGLATPPAPNYGAAIAAGIAGATQIATITSATIKGFAKGAIDIGGTGTSTSDSMLAYIGRHESVINGVSTRRHKNLLEAINADNGTSSSINNTYVGGNQVGNVIVNIHNNGSNEVRQESSVNADGQKQIDVFIDQVENRLAQKYADGNGKLAKAIDGKRLRNY